MPPALSVVVPVRNGEHSLPGLLDALAAQTVGALEVLVVDNNSTDGTAALAAAHPVVTEVLTETRPGSYAARNAGLARATGDVVLFTDADCRPAPGWAAALAGAVRAPEPALAAGPVVLGTDSPTPWRRVWGAYDRAMYLDQERSVGELGAAATANLAVRREVLLAQGGFDGSLASGGDHAFTSAAVAAGHQLVYVPEAVVHHPPRDTLSETWKLWRRLGGGYEDLVGRGEWPQLLRRDPVLREPFASVRARAVRRGVTCPAPALALAHALARAAVLRGRLQTRRLRARAQ